MDRRGPRRSTAKGPARVNLQAILAEDCRRVVPECAPTTNKDRTISLKLTASDCHSYPVYSANFLRAPGRFRCYSAPDRFRASPANPRQSSHHRSVQGLIATTAPVNTSTSGCTITAGFVFGIWGDAVRAPMAIEDQRSPHEPQTIYPRMICPADLRRMCNVIFTEP
jgi:hypothetical protein